MLLKDEDEDAKTTQASGLQTLSFEGGGPTRCHGVLEHGLHLHRNIPLTVGLFWDIQPR